MEGKKTANNYFREKEYSYCFNASEPVSVRVRNEGNHLFTLKGSCYDPIEKWPKRGEKK